MIIHRVTIWSTHEHYFLKPACSSLRSLSISCFMLSGMIQQSILLLVDSRVIPYVIVRLRHVIFLWNLSSSPLHQSSGICSSCQILFSNLCMQVIDTSSSALVASGRMLSMPPVLPVFEFWFG